MFGVDSLFIWLGAPTGSAIAAGAGRSGKRSTVVFLENIAIILSAAVT